jgi:hypothetical protein
MLAIKVMSGYDAPLSPLLTAPSVTNSNSANAFWEYFSIRLAFINEPNVFYQSYMTASAQHSTVLVA